MQNSLFAAMQVTMNRSQFICLLAILYFICLNGVSPVSNGICKIMASKSYDCSSQDLKIIPDTVDLPSNAMILDFSFNQLVVLDNTTFSRLTDLVTLDLTRCHINWIYDNTFQNQRDLKSLALVGNPLAFMAIDAFAGPLALRHLSLAQTLIDDFKFLPYDSLMFLETLELGSNDIYSLHDLKQFNWETLTTLNLQLNDLESISADEVAVLKKGRMLNISFSGNNLLYVEPRAFESCHFNRLDFTDSFNEAGISMILAGLQGAQTNTLLLGKFDENEAPSIESKALQAFCNITVKDLRFQLQHFSDPQNIPFQCLSGVETLVLTRAHLSFLPASIHQMTSLSTLILNQNKFKNLCDANISGLSSLSTLILKDNFDRPLLFDDGCLSGLSKLEQLDLSGSDLATGTECCEIQLTGLGHLLTLNLSHSAQMKWSVLPFRKVPNLRSLDCRNILITRDSECTTGPLQNLQNLTQLFISWDFVDPICSVHFLEGLQNLQYLSLNGSSFKNGVVNESRMFVHVPLLQNLDLSNSAISAIADNTFVYLNKLAYVDLSSNELAVVNTNAFHGLSNILLNFARNSIEIVNIQSVERLGENGKIDLSDNPLACNCSNVQFIVWMQANSDKVQSVDRVRCGDSRKRLLDVQLKCFSSAGALAFGLICLFLGISAVAFVIVKKRRKNDVQYEPL